MNPVRRRLNQGIRWYEAFAFLGALFIVMRVIVAAPRAAPPGIVSFLDYTMIAAIPMLGIGVLTWVRAATRRDIETNVLEALVGEMNIREFGDGQFTFWLSQIDPSHLRITVLVQNARAGEAVVHLVLNAHQGAGYLLHHGCAIDLRLAGAELVAACAVLPLKERDDDVRLSFSVDGHCRARGRRVRFGRYPLIEKPKSAAILAMGVIGGHIFLGRGGSRLAVDLEAGPRAATNHLPIRWRVLWRPADPVDLDAVRRRLEELTSEPEDHAIIAEAD